MPLWSVSVEKFENAVKINLRRRFFYLVTSHALLRVEIDIGNQSISSADCYRLLRKIDDNRSHRKNCRL